MRAQWAAWSKWPSNERSPRNSSRMRRGTVRTRCRWGTGAQMVPAIKAPSMSVRRRWQEAPEAALLAGEGEEEFVVAVGAMEVGEAGVEVSAAPEGGDGAGGRRPIGRRILRCGRGESARPPRRGAGGAVEAADHGR